MTKSWYPTNFSGFYLNGQSYDKLTAWVQIPRAIGAIAPPAICQEGLNIAQAPQKMMK